MTGDLNYSKVLNQLYPEEIYEAKIILRRLEYNGEVRQFRNTWHIKPEGFSSNAEFEKWWKNTLLSWANKETRGQVLIFDIINIKIKNTYLHHMPHGK